MIYTVLYWTYTTHVYSILCYSVVTRDSCIPSIGTIFYMLRSVIHSTCDLIFCPCHFHFLWRGWSELETHWHGCSRCYRNLSTSFLHACYFMPFSFKQVPCQLFWCLMWCL